MKATLAVAAVTLCLLMLGCGGNNVTAPSNNEAPILPPQNVRVSMNAYGDVMIRWDPNTQPNLRGYNVYRLDVDDSRIGTLTVSPITNHFFMDDTAMPEKDYEYRVTSVSTRGSESTFAMSTIHTPVPGDTGTKMKPEQ